MDTVEIGGVIVQALPFLQFQGDASFADVLPFNLFLKVCPNCTIQPPLDFRSCPSRVVGWGSGMCLDTGRVFKRPVLCPQCNEDYLFTLRAIAENPTLRCHGCGGGISLHDSVYELLLRDVRNTLETIDSFQIEKSRSAA
jgi:hypothetical protein